MVGLMSDNFSEILDYLILIGNMILSCFFAYQILNLVNLSNANLITDIYFLKYYFLNLLGLFFCVWRVIVRIKVIMVVD